MFLVDITIFLLLSYALLIIYYWRAWLSIPSVEVPVSFTPVTTISVVIPARNEENNIGACLHALVQQDYPEHLLEIIVVNDFSEDKTADVVKSFKISHLKLINLHEELNDTDLLNSYKKKGIEIAIQKSSGNLIVCTDADCIANSRWLKTIAFFYEQNHPVFIASPVSFYNDNGALQVFQSLDFLSLQGITGASVFKRIHTMCNGANLAYEKKVFNEVNGFRGIDQIASGDDMLLMHKIYQLYPSRVMYLKSENAIVRANPADTIGEFFSQRIRWASKAAKYEDKRIFWTLLLVYLFNLSLLTLFAVCFFTPKLWLWLAALVFTKFLVELIFLLPVSRFFGKEKLLWFFLPAQPFHILYTVIAGFFGQFGTYTWKGRRVK